MQAGAISPAQYIGACALPANSNSSALSSSPPATMIFSQSFVAFVALALTASATPVVRDTSLVTLSFAKHIHLAGVQNIIAQDQARAKWLKSPSRGKQLVKRAESAPVTNTAISYLATVDVGNPPQSCQLFSHVSAIIS